MRFRLNPFKILRLIVIIAFIVYAFVLGKQFMKEKNKKTDEVTKEFEIRKNDFHNSENKTKENNDEQKKENSVQENEKKESGSAEQNSQSQTLTTENKEETNKIKEESQPPVEAEAAKKAEELKKEQETQKIQNELLAQKKKEVEAAKKAKEKEEAEKKAKENAVKKTAGRKYLQVATLQTDAAARKVATQLGGNFTVQPVKGTSGKTMYRVVSISTDNPQTLSAMEAQVKNKFGSSYKYIVRTAGK